MNRRGVDAVHSHDVVVIGAGIAGLSAALGLAPRSVALLTKVPFGTGGSTLWAQGGMAAAVGADDSPDLHAADTIAVAGGLADEAAVALLAAEGAESVPHLLELGVAFDRDAEGRLALGREAAHGRRRILHAHGDATGAELGRALAAAVRRTPGISVFERVFAEELVSEGGRIVGVLAQQDDGTRALFVGRAIVLATGGIGRVYAHTTNPLEVTGDGLAMAARAGAELVDLEMVQFHPTALATGADPMPLVTEALRGEGAWLIDQDGRRFMPAEHSEAELAPRDVVARAIHRRLLRGDRVFLDTRAAVGEAFPERFPRVFELCREAGLDPRREPIPVSPAAHYHMGGVATDTAGRTSLTGLWACGEVASTGVHGANRLASNSLLEGVVFGARVAEDIAHEMPAVIATPRLSTLPAAPVRDAAVEAEVSRMVRRTMWQHVGLERTAGGLETAARELRHLAEAHPRLGGEAGNLLLVARCVTAAALARPESRGGHFRSDHPAADPAWQRRLSWVLDAHAEPRLLPARGRQRVARRAGGRG